MEILSQAYIHQLQTDLNSISKDAVEHLEALAHTDADRTKGGYAAYWDYTTSEEQQAAAILRTKIAVFSTQLIEAIKASPLFEPVDQDKMRRNLRRMSSSLFLRSYIYSPPQEIYGDHSRVYGVKPAENWEDNTDPQTALNLFKRSALAVADKIELLAPTPDNIAGAIVSSQAHGLLKVRPGTAFIMMQIDDKIPKLEDINNTIKRSFQEFGINAVRADEIEHSGIITQRILDEIATSEFLIADLTGERPSVYYEVGFAHALGKRPILYREAGSRLHFDLLVHNVPEYKNATELSKMLRERLKAVTGRDPKERT